MQYEDELLAAKGVELSAELETEEIVEPYDPEDPVPLNQLQGALDAITELSEIRDTIATEGVSSHDLLAVENVRTKLIEQGINIPKNVSVESYIKLTSGHRTSINVDVSLESIAKTILEAIKGWILWLVDAFVKGTRWFKAVLMNDNLVHKKTQGFVVAALKMEGIVAGTIKTLRQSDLVEANEQHLNDEIQKITLQNINDPKLDKNAMVEAILGDKSKQQAIKLAHMTLTLAATHLIKLTDDLHKLINEYDPMDLTLDVSPVTPRGFATLELSLDSLVEPLDQFDMIRFSKNNDFYKRARDTLTNYEYFNYQSIYKDYTKAAENITKLQRAFKAKNIEDIDGDIIQERIKQVNECLKIVYKGVETFNKYKVFQTKVAVLHFNQFNMMFDLILSNSSVKGTEKLKSSLNNVNGVRKSVGL